MLADTVSPLELMWTITTVLALCAFLFLLYDTFMTYIEMKILQQSKELMDHVFDDFVEQLCGIYLAGGFSLIGILSMFLPSSRTDIGAVRLAVTSFFAMSMVVAFTTIAVRKYFRRMNDYRRIREKRKEQSSGK